MAVDITQPTAQDGLSLQELELYHQITAYRASLGLAALPLSAALTTTAGRHVEDTRQNIWAEGVELPEGANLHSWSDAYYYGDHRDPSVMWDAPERVGTGYTSSGYEISAAGFATTAEALEGWIGSPSHNAILTQTGVWEGIELRAIGIGVDTSAGAGVFGGRIFHVWFGEAADPTIPDIFGTAEDDQATGTEFADRIFGEGGGDTILGGAGDDLLRGGAGADWLHGEDGDDQLYGDAGRDRLFGGPGSDYLHGGTGADVLRGGEGDDQLLGGGGADVLLGGAGRDTLTGGGGTDSFAYLDVSDSPAGWTTRDVITDFTIGEDRIELQRIDADPSTPEDDAFRFIGSESYSGVAGELRLTSNGLLTADLDGDRSSDFVVEVVGITSLSESDFLL